MMKRILSLLLAMCMLCLVMTGCASDLDKAKDYINDPENQPTPETPKITLSFYLVTDEKLSSDSLSLMQNAFNEEIEVLYKTHVEFINVTIDEYNDVLASKLTAVEDAIASGETDSTDTLGDYPPLSDTQLDIVLITSYDQLAGMIEKEQVVDLTAYLESTAYRVIKNSMSESVLYGSKINGKYYAVPNCHVMGEYTYLLVDMETAERYGYAQMGIVSPTLTDWASTADLRAAITAAGTYDYSSYDDATYCEDPNAPVRIVRGDYASRAEYADSCFVYVEKTPSVNASELFNSALAISSYSASADRAMQILYAINTNKTLRTMLQYGVEGTTFSYTEERDAVELKTGTYVYNVNSLYIGNIFALYPCIDKDETAEMMESWKAHNDDLQIIDDLTPTPPEGTPAE